MAFASIALAATAMASETVYPALQEPKHRPVFHNELIDVYDVRLAAGERSFFHHHTNDQLAIVMRSGTSMNETQGSSEAENRSERGAISYIPHSQTGGLVHRVRVPSEARGVPAFWVIGVEFANPAKEKAETRRVPPEHRQFSFPQGRLDRVTIPIDGSYEVAGHLLIVTTDAILSAPEGERWSFKEGDVRWIGGASMKLRNDGPRAISLVVLTLNDR